MSVSQVTARFYVREVTYFAYAGGWASPAPLAKVVMAPVNGSKGEENKKWASATPSGEFIMTVGNPEASDWFKSMLGKDVAITIEERND